MQQLLDPVVLGLADGLVEAALPAGGGDHVPKADAAGRKPLERVAAEDDGRLVFIEATQIQCIESRGNHIVLHTAERSHLLRSTLQQAETMLNHGSLMRIHRGIVINRSFVRELERTPGGEYQFTMANGQKFVSSAGYRQAVLDYLKQSKV